MIVRKDYCKDDCCYFASITDAVGAPNAVSSMVTCLPYTTASQILINNYTATFLNSQYTTYSTVNCGSNQMINTTTGITSNTQLNTGYTNSNTNTTVYAIANAFVSPFLSGNSSLGICAAISYTPAYNKSYCNTNSTANSACCYLSLSNSAGAGIYSCLPQAFAVNANTALKKCFEY